MRPLPKRNWKHSRWVSVDVKRYEKGKGYYYKDSMTKYYKCSKCGEEVKKAMPGKTFWDKCPHCGDFYFHFLPTGMQALQMSMKNSTLVLYQAVGTGKTDVDVYYPIQLALMYPGTIIGYMAADGKQLKNVIYKEKIPKFLPRELTKSWNTGEIELKNGSRIILLESKTVDSLRSYEFDISVFVEASGIPENVYNEVSTNRMRGKAIPMGDMVQGEEGNFRQVIVETNITTQPWIHRLIKESHHIFYTEHCDREGINYYKDKAKPVWRESKNYSAVSGKMESNWVAKDVVTITTTSHENDFTGKNYIDTLYANKTKEQADAEVHSKLLVDNGRVLKNVPKSIVNAFPIPEHWPKMHSMDFGFSADPTANIWAAMQPIGEGKEDHVVWYVFKSRNSKVPSDLQETLYDIKMWEDESEIREAEIIKRVIDIAAEKNESDLKTLATKYREVGRPIFPEKGFNFAYASERGKLIGYQILDNLLKKGYVKIFDSEVDLTDDLMNLTLKEKPNGDGFLHEILEENDHRPDALRYMFSGLTQDGMDIYFKEKDEDGSYNRILVRPSEIVIKTRELEALDNYNTKLEQHRQVTNSIKNINTLNGALGDISFMTNSNSTDYFEDMTPEEQEKFINEQNKKARFDIDRQKMANRDRRRVGMKTIKRIVN